MTDNFATWLQLKEYARQQNHNIETVERCSNQEAFNLPHNITCIIIPSPFRVKAFMPGRAKKASGVSDCRVSLHKSKVTFLHEIDRLID